eukprot:scaffold57_cov254-Pinguiococcus_pyrenoidosus.AAC.2
MAILLRTIGALEEIKLKSRIAVDLIGPAQTQQSRIHLLLGTRDAAHESGRRQARHDETVLSHRPPGVLGILLGRADPGGEKMAPRSGIRPQTAEDDREDGRPAGRSNPAVRCCALRKVHLTPQMAQTLISFPRELVTERAGHRPQTRAWPSAPPSGKTCSFRDCCLRAC